jgi:hypothetical protein
MILVKTIGVMIASGMGVMLVIFISDRAMLAYPRSTKMVFKAVLFTMQAVFLGLCLLAMLSARAVDNGCADEVFCMRTSPGIRS